MLYPLLSSLLFMSNEKISQMFLFVLWHGNLKIQYFLSIKLSVTFNVLVFNSKSILLIFCEFRKRVLDQNGPYRCVKKIGNYCLAIVLGFCQSIVVCLWLVSAYSSLCRGLEYLLKIRHILVHPNVAIFDFRGFFVQVDNTALRLEKTQKYGFSNTYLHQTFTECVSNQCTHFDISTY